MGSTVDRSDSTLGRAFIGSRVVIMAVVAVGAVVAGVGALATGAEDPGIPFLVVAVCVVGIVVGVRYLRR